MQDNESLVEVKYAGDLTVARSILAGDEAVFNRFYEEHFDRLYGFAFYRLGGDQPVAEEVVQATFVAALEGLDRFEGNCRLFTWLCAIARHKIADHFRQREKDERRQMRLSLLPGGLDDVGEETMALPDPEDEVMREQARQQTVAALGSLPGRYQQALILKYVEGLSVELVSHEMQRSAKAVESLLSRARAAFARAYVALNGGANE
ncbi:MAG: RNA polymerase sigma factor [Dehalococcoidia bacterium]|nr:RNA polymerase sigma factor [Dehalococcoidia bacterium]